MKDYSTFYLSMLYGTFFLFGMISSLEFGCTSFEFIRTCVFSFLMILFTYLYTKEKLNTPKNKNTQK